MTSSLGGWCQYLLYLLFQVTHRPVWVRFHGAQSTDGYYRGRSSAIFSVRDRYGSLSSRMAFPNYEFNGIQPGSTNDSGRVQSHRFKDVQRKNSFWKKRTKELCSRMQMVYIVKMLILPMMIQASQGMTQDLYPSLISRGLTF